MNRKLVTGFYVLFFLGSLPLISANTFENCCSVPHDKQVLCTDLPYNFDPHTRGHLQRHFGEPKSAPTCRISYYNELEPIVNLNSCGIGIITRRFEIFSTDPWFEPFICEQKVEILGNHEYLIKFPANASSDCGVPTPEDIQTFEIDCDLLAVSVNDEKLVASPDACYKILRTYRVVNWCEFDEESSRPIVISRDEDCDGDPGDEDVWVIRRNDGQVYIDADNNENNNFPSAGDLKSCHDGQPGYWRSFSVAEGQPLHPNTGLWQYTQVIKVFDHNAPVISATPTEPFCSLNNSTCAGQATIPFSIEEICTPNDLTIRVYIYENGVEVPPNADHNQADGLLSGNYPNYQIQGIFPIGHHEAAVQVEDGCGNDRFIKIPFSVVDCKAPAPICLESVSAAAMPVRDENGQIVDGMAVVWATDFVRSPIDDCSLPITYSVHKQVNIDNGDEVPSPDSISVTVSCVDGQAVPVYVYAWDQAGLADKCESNIIVNDEFNSCGLGANPVIAGQITTQHGHQMQAVTVNLTGMGAETTITSNDGIYVFNQLNNGMDYIVTPRKNDDHKNGVNTMDLIAMQRHILSVEKIEDPYAIIAGDANLSGNLTALDLIQVRKIILSIDTTFKYTDSWRFVDKHFEFSDPSDPFLDDFPEYVALNGIDSSFLNMDFVAIKVGNVTGPLQFDSHSALEVSTRNSATATLSMENKLIQTGGTISLPIKLQSNDLLSGGQFELSFNPGALSLIDIQFDGIITEDQVNAAPNEMNGKLLVSWHQSNGQNFPESEIPLFTLVFEGKRDGALQEYLQLSNQLLSSEAYEVNGNSHRLLLAYQQLNTIEKLTMLQNSPNPFQENTQVKFYLPEAAHATFSIYDLAGTLIQLKHQFYEKGWQTIQVNAEHLPQGVLVYQIKTSSETISKKMIVQ